LRLGLRENEQLLAYSRYTERRVLCWRLRWCESPFAKGDREPTTRGGVHLGVAIITERKASTSMAMEGKALEGGRRKISEGGGKEWKIGGEPSAV